MSTFQQLIESYPIFDQITHIPVALWSNNLGDDIQSVAASRLFGVWDYVNRDYMETWPKESLTPMVGWFTYGKIDTSKDVLVVGTHIEEKSIQKFSHPVVIDWLRAQIKQQGFPAMVRDLYTRDFMRSFGLDAEFLGCFTQTLVTRRLERNRFLAIDVSPTDIPKYYDHISNDDSKLQKMDYRERIFEAQKRIDLIDSAKHVYTTKLHAYLPCKALGVDVTLLKEQITYQPMRFSGHID